MARARLVFLAGFAALAATLLLSACGGDDGGDTAADDDHAVPYDIVKKLPEGLNTRQAFRRLDATPEQSYEKLGGKSGDVLFVCYRFLIADGGPSDRAELCFRRDRYLTSIGATRTSPGGGGVVPGGVPVSP